MNPTDRLLRLIAARFGLTSEDRFYNSLTRLLEKLSQEQGKTPETIVRLAETDEALLRELAGQVTVGESYFYRHSEHFDILMREIRARFNAREDTGPIIIWSAGCAAGQEPYSIAIACHEHLSVQERARVIIIASDLDPEAIQIAKRGCYFKWSFRGLSPERRAHYFIDRGNGCFELEPEIRRMVRFGCSSVQEQAAQLLARVDYIFFRNVSIYLDQVSQDAVFDRFREIMHRGGRLFMAPSDPAPPRSYFRLAPGPSTSVYRGIALDEARSQAPIFNLTPPVDSPIREHLISPSPLRCQSADVDPRTERVSPPAGGNSIGNNGSTVDQPTGQPCGDYEGYMLRGQHQLADGLTEKATDAFRRAVFLCPGDPLARFWYAFSLQRNGVPKRSLVQINQLFSSLCEMSADEILSDGQTTVGDLLRATEQLKEKLI